MEWCKSPGVSSLKLGRPSRESLRVPAKEYVKGSHAMALSQSALLEILDTIKEADVADRVRESAATIYQALIEAESVSYTHLTLPTNREV